MRRWTYKTSGRGDARGGAPPAGGGIDDAELDDPVPFTEGQMLEFEHHLKALVAQEHAHMKLSYLVAKQARRREAAYAAFTVVLRAAGVVYFEDLSGWKEQRSHLRLAHRRLRQVHFPRSSPDAHDQAFNRMLKRALLIKDPPRATGAAEFGGALEAAGGWADGLMFDADAPGDWAELSETDRLMLDRFAHDFGGEPGASDEEDLEEDDLGGLLTAQFGDDIGGFATAADGFISGSLSEDEEEVTEIKVVVELENEDEDTADATAGGAPRECHDGKVYLVKPREKDDASAAVLRLVDKEKLNGDVSKLTKVEICAVALTYFGKAYAAATTLKAVLVADLQGLISARPVVLPAAFDSAVAAAARAQGEEREELHGSALPPAGSVVQVLLAHPNPQLRKYQDVWRKMPGFSLMPSTQTHMYGELTMGSVWKIWFLIGLYANLTADDQMFDYGAGRGMWVFAAFFFAPLQFRNMNVLGAEMDYDAWTYFTQNKEFFLKHFAGVPLPNITQLFGDSKNVSTWGKYTILVQYDGPTVAKSRLHSLPLYWVTIMRVLFTQPHIKVIFSTKMDQACFDYLFVEDGCEVVAFGKWSLVRVTGLNMQGACYTGHLWFRDFQLELREEERAPVTPWATKGQQSLEVKLAAAALSGPPVRPIKAKSILTTNMQFQQDQFANWVSVSTRRVFEGALNAQGRALADDPAGLGALLKKGLTAEQYAGLLAHCAAEAAKTNASGGGKRRRLLAS